MKLKTAFFALFAAGLLLAETPLELKNPGFEDEELGWQVGAMSHILPDIGRDGSKGLRVIDDSTTQGSSCRAVPVPATPGKSYAVRFWAYNVDSPNTVGVYIQFLDEKGKILNTPSLGNELIHAVPHAREWKQFTLVGKAPEKTVSLSIWVHSFNGSMGKTDFDDFSVAELDEEEAKTVKSTNQVQQRQRKFPTPEPELIASIAEMLPDKPRGIGAPASDREQWDKLAQLPEAEAIIKSAEGYIDTLPPVMEDEVYLEYTTNGNRTNYERLMSRRTGRIETLALAEALEYKGRFIKPLERDLNALFEEKSWVMPAHDSSLVNFNQTRFYPDLGASQTARMLAHHDWWLGDKLSPETRQRLRFEVQRRIIGPYQEIIRTGDIFSGMWWSIATNNWNAVCTSNLVSTSLVLLDDKNERAEILAAAVKATPFFLSGFTPDGNCSEGIGYWSYGFGFFMTMAETILEATDGKLNLYDINPQHTEKICAYARDIQLQEGLAPAFADCGVGARADQSTLLYIQRRFPNALLNRQEMTRPLNRGYTNLALLAFGDETKYAEKVPEKGTLPIRSTFNDAGIYIGRAIGEEQEFSVAIKAGHNNEMHNHNDVGSFTVAYNGRPYFLDPGVETYTRRTFSAERYMSDMLNSYGHQVPFIAGQRQSGGQASNGTFIKQDFTDEEDTVVIDYKNAYLTVLELKALTRTLVFNRKSMTTTVQDKVEFTTPTTFETALVTYSKLFERAKDTILAYDANGSIQATIKVDGAGWTTKTETIETINNNKPKRVGITLDKPVLEATVTIELKPMPLADDLPGFYHAPNEDDFKPNLDNAITIQAEKIAGQEGGEIVVEPKVGAEGEAFKLWDKSGHKLTWEFQVDKAGTYAIQLKYCHAHADQVTRKLFVDDARVGNDEAPLLFPSTGGWSSKEDQWKNIWLATNKKAILLDLEPGKHYLTLENDDNKGLNLDWLKLVPAQK